MTKKDRRLLQKNMEINIETLNYAVPNFVVTTTMDDLNTASDKEDKNTTVTETEKKQYDDKKVIEDVVCLLTRHVTYNIAALLENRIQSKGRCYAAEDDVFVIYANDNGDGEERVYDQYDFINVDASCCNGKTLYAPTYAEVLDWMYQSWGVFVDFTPYYTFALREHVGFTYAIWRKSERESRFKKIFERTKELSSFPLAIEDILTEIFRRINTKSFV